MAYFFWKFGDSPTKTGNKNRKNMSDLMNKVGFVAAAVMPVWNVPLIIRIVRRKSSKDISLAWLFGVWGCIVLMFPATLNSSDFVFKVFWWTNIVFFSMVVITVIVYRK